MQFRQTTLNNAWLIVLEPIHDLRGFFSRTFCAREFAERGLEVSYPQHSVSFSKRMGSLRGMHFQHRPCAETKIVRCARGIIWDVIVDLRQDSSTYRRWQGFELSDRNYRQLYIPEGFAHGFQTLSENVEVTYLISTPYAPELAGGFRYDDPGIGVNWPLPVTCISERDLAWPIWGDTEPFPRVA